MFSWIMKGFGKFFANKFGMPSFCAGNAEGGDVF